MTLQDLAENHADWRARAFAALAIGAGAYILSAVLVFGLAAGIDELAVACVGALAAVVGVGAMARIPFRSVALLALLGLVGVFAGYVLFHVLVPLGTVSEGSDRRG